MYILVQGSLNCSELDFINLMLCMASKGKTQESIGTKLGQELIWTEIALHISK